MCTATCRAQADTQRDVRETKLLTSSEGTGTMVLYLTERNASSSVKDALWVPSG